MVSRFILVNLTDPIMIQNYICSRPKNKSENKRKNNTFMCARLHLSVPTRSTSTTQLVRIKGVGLIR